MAKIEITEKNISGDNLYYLQTSLGEIFNHADCTLRSSVVGDRIKLTVNCPEYYADIIKAEIADKVSEIVAVKYKYDFFQKELIVGGLSKEEKEILLVSLIAADLEEDKKYCFDRFKNLTEITVDGVYNFRMQPLKKKWIDIVGYMPTCFLSSQLKEFISYLMENRRKRVYVDNGKVYDGHYRRLKRHTLLGYDKLNVVREVILSNCSELEICGPLPNDDEHYLREYYGDKIIFSTGYFN